MGLSMDSPLCVAFLSILFIIFDLPPGSDLFKEFERNTRSRDTSGTLTNTELRLKTNISHCYHVALLVSLTICLVIFILLVTFAYLRYKHREDRRQRYMAENSTGRKEEFGGPGTSTLSEQ